MIDWQKLFGEVHVFQESLHWKEFTLWLNRCWLSLRFITCRIFSITCWFYRLMIL